jgi:hypothetical protein
MRPASGARLRVDLLTALLGIGVLACGGAGRFVREILRERPSAPLDSMGVASDARIDSLGYVVGSFIGEGTSRAVHLLSSDTSFIAALVRRYQPALTQAGDLWSALARQRLVTLGPSGRRRIRPVAPLIDRAVVGGPSGHTTVTAGAILIHGGRCGWPGAQVEIIVEPDRQSSGPPLRGPVLGSFTRSGATADNARTFRIREPLPHPGDSLIAELVARTEQTMDSVLTRGFRSLQLRGIPEERPEINTLADAGAADVVSFRPRASASRFAVSLRKRRITTGGDTLLASTVMAWDSSGSWQQIIFRPTLVSIRRGQLVPYAAMRRSLFWRRLQPISDFGFERDNLWMEQVDVRDGRVLWGIVQPRGNVVVAAAEVQGSCR